MCVGAVALTFWWKLSLSKCRPAATVSSEYMSDSSSASAGPLVGGARGAAPTGRNEIVNGFQSWEYRFPLENMTLPAVRFAEDTRVTTLNEELWVAPEVDAESRY